MSDLDASYILASFIEDAMADYDDSEDVEDFWKMTGTRYGEDFSTLVAHPRKRPDLRFRITVERVER